MAVLIVGIILLLMALLVMFLFYQKKMMEKDQVLNEREIKLQKELLNASLELAEQERRRIAANIHDDIGMALHVMKVNLSRARRNTNDQQILEEVLAETENLVSNTITITRILSYDLMPPSLVSFGLIEGLEYLVKYIAETKIMKVELRSEKAHVPLDERTKLHLYRLIREVFNNILKHARASRATINISFSENAMRIVIEHNGKGISNEFIKRLAESGRGIGLRNIIGRSQLINATVQYAIVDKEISKIIIEMPLV